ncbi:TipAS antibiotic-recognition domain-containing protein [Vallitalea sp.]|uniref:TipAS antibiotic-recognition domain-containing protein n=1 Tax=Vallitalea sp. TaxID=1882829 RepID=UPI003FCE2C9A
MQWQDYITQNHYNCTNEMLQCLALMYVSNQNQQGQIQFRHWTCSFLISFKFKKIHIVNSILVVIRFKDKIRISSNNTS